METIVVDEFLEHHGIKGMKWGIRNPHLPKRNPLKGRAKLLKTRNPVSERTRREMMTAKAKQPSIEVDETPWSNYKQSDYSTTQWHNASLIHNHSEAPTAKSQCKLPIKTPNGVVNRHGVYAAAAVLAGSRGGVQATSEQKAEARRKLRTIYSQMAATPPPSLGHSDVNEFLEHYGVKGMHWGIRNPDRPSKRGNKAVRTRYEKSPSRLSDDELNRRIRRMELEKRYSDLNEEKKSSGKKYVHDILQNSGKMLVSTALSTVATFIIKRILDKKFPKPPKVGK